MFLFRREKKESKSEECNLISRDVCPLFWSPPEVPYPSGRAREESEDKAFVDPKKSKKTVFAPISPVVSHPKMHFALPI